MKERWKPFDEVANNVAGVPILDRCGPVPGCLIGYSFDEFGEAAGEFAVLLGWGGLFGGGHLVLSSSELRRITFADSLRHGGSRV